MNDRKKALHILLLNLFVCLLLATAASSAAAEESSPSRSVTCALSNPGYSGWCRVTETVPPGATAAKVCKNVLRCLNDVRCIKTYCNATTIRTNWRLEEIQTKKKKIKL
jgi:hypothetical protein